MVPILIFHANGSQFKPSCDQGWWMFCVDVWVSLTDFLLLFYPSFWEALNYYYLNKIKGLYFHSEGMPVFMMAFFPKDNIRKHWKTASQARLDLLFKSQQWKYQNNVWKLVELNNKDIRTTTLTSLWCLHCLIWTDFTYCSGVSTDGFGQAYNGWV